MHMTVISFFFTPPVYTVFLYIYITPYLYIYIYIYIWFWPTLHMLYKDPARNTIYTYTYIYTVYT